MSYGAHFPHLLDLNLAPTKLTFEDVAIKPPWDETDIPPLWPKFDEPLRMPTMEELGVKPFGDLLQVRCKS